MLARELDRIGSAYEAVLNQMLNNGLMSATDLAYRREGIVGALEALAAADGPLRAAPRAADTIAGREMAAEMLVVAAKEMDMVRRRMLLLEGRAALAAAVEEISAAQEDVLEESRAQLQRLIRELLGE
jgi:hypothetical protein